MANITVAPVPLPPSPPPQPAWRSFAAELARRRLVLAAAAVTAVIYLILGSVWLLFASLGLRLIGRVACGDGCAVVAAGNELTSFATASLVVLFLVALTAAVCSICMVVCNNNADAVKVPSLTDFTPADQPVLYVLMLGMFAFLAFVLLILIGVLMRVWSPVNGSRADRSGSLIIDAGVFSLVMLDCFIILPAMALFVWGRLLLIWQHII